MLSNRHQAMVYAVSIHTMVCRMRESVGRTICSVYVERWEDDVCYRKHDGIAQFCFEQVSHRMEKRNSHKSKNRRQRPEPTASSLLCPPYNISYVSKRVKAICWQVRMRLRYMQC